MKTFRNFLVANLCALVPLWYVAFGWMPDQVKVYMRGASADPVFIVADGATMLGEDYGAWAAGRIWRFYLREGMEWKNLAFRLPGDLDAAAVERIELQKWKFLFLGKGGARLEKAESAHNEYRYPKPRFEQIGFASKTIGMGFLGLEFLLFAISWIFARRHREEHWHILLPSVLGVSLALTLLMQVTLPIQSYIANQSSFPFALPALCVAVAVRFVLLFAWNTLAIFLLARCFGRWVLAPVFAFTVCAYLESGILAEGQPSLNGDWAFFEDRIRARWDTAVWGGVFALVFAVHRWLKNWYGVAGLCTVVMLAASMLDIKPEQKADTSTLIVNDFSPIETVIRSVTYSTNRNVMVFVIDSLEREQAHAIMEDPEAGPDLREQFRGFTEYVDNMGTGFPSEYAVPTLFTGKNLEKIGELFDFFVSMYSEDSILKQLLQEQFNVYLAPDMGYGYANPVKTSNPAKGSGQQEKSVFKRMDHGWNLEEIDRFRWMPFPEKLRCAIITQLKRPEEQICAYERISYPILASAEVGHGTSKTFLFLHTWGVHNPILLNRHGEHLMEANDTDEGAIEEGIFVLGQLGRLFDTYREKGIYDNSLIMIMADHGNHVHRPDATKDGLPGIARPFLWVKPVNSRHEFTKSHLPTSLARVSAVLSASMEHDLDESEINDILQMKKRLFRLTLGENRQDWMVNSDGYVAFEEGMLAIPAGEGFPALKTNHVYSFDLAHTPAEDLKGIQLSGFFIRFFPRWNPGSPEIKITFKVPDPHSHYDVRLQLNLWCWSPAETAENLPGACLRFRQAGTECNWLAVEATDTADVIIKDVFPDSRGIIRIEGTRDAGIHSIVRLVQLEITPCTNR